MHPRLLFATALLAGVQAASPPVKVALRSSWSAPPFLVELLETVGLENPDSFFPFLDRITDPENSLDWRKLTPEALHQYALDTAVNSGLLSEPGASAAVEMKLALHAATPKIEAFYQYYSNSKQNVDCGSWVDWYGTVVCEVETLAQLAGIDTIDPANVTSDSKTYNRPKILPFDHVYPSLSSLLETPPRTAILYASLDSPNFRDLHSFLYWQASRPLPHVEYILRHVPKSSGHRTHLTGYSVSLDLKKTDYLAVDDRFQTKSSSQSSDDVETDEDVDPITLLIRNHPENASIPDANTPLTEDEIQELGQKATQIIAESSEPLATLKRLSQDFPKYATSLARRVEVNQSITKELHENQLTLPGGANVFWLNGVSIAEKDVTPFDLLRTLKKERANIQALTSLGLERGQAMDLLTHIAIATNQVDKGVFDGLVDASDRTEDVPVIVYWNDIEKDKRYSQWTSSIYMLLRPTYPGQFPNIKRNLFTVILLLDLSQLNSLNFIGGPVSNIIDRQYPVRFGVVPLLDTEEGKKMAKVFYYIVNNHGRKKAMTFIKKLARDQAASNPSAFTVDWEMVSDQYDDVCDDEEGCEIADIDDVLEGKVGKVELDKVASYAARLGASLSSSPFGHGFVNGRHFPMGDNFLRNMQMEISNQLQALQEELYMGKITDDTDSIGTYFYDLPTTVKRRNRHIIPGKDTLRIDSMFEALALSKYPSAPGTFLFPGEQEIVPLTTYIVVDLDSEEGLALVIEALKSTNDESRMRLTLVHNPSTSKSVEDPSAKRAPVSWLFSYLITNNLLSKKSPSQILSVLGLDEPFVLDQETQMRFFEKENVLSLTDGSGLAEFDASAYYDWRSKSRLLCRELQIGPGDNAIVMNGRIVGPVGIGEFTAEDFKALEAYELRKRVQPVLTAIEDVIPDVKSLDRASLAHLVSMSSSLINALQIPDPSEVGLFDAPVRPRQRAYRILDSNYTAFSFGDNSTALYQIAVSVDPLSEVAQKWSSILEWLANVPDVFIEVHLNPARTREIPLKRFFRYNLAVGLSFDEKGNEVPAETVIEDLPIEPIYTLAMDVPTSWLVRPREALYDLDNIQLGALSPEDKSLDAIFDLDYIVVEGHARDTFTNSPPRGVQLELLDGNGTHIDDTQVVANLGYFQFKAKPGVFQLEIREGRGKKIFEMESVGNEGWESRPISQVGNEITVTSFEGLTLYPRLSRKPGFETADVLAEETHGKAESVVSWVKSMFGQSDSTVVDVQSEAQADINIFTVASGLLYERFVSIMILSVMRNTKSSVKFWFIENFLSPSFLEFIPHLAERYGFQYELVTYKWPSWLRAQKEKQRIIWAYKILFLDVLFPMDLKKVIFVDADQIVRADLKELVDLDLHGAPYGYTPMGDDNTDMEGFRFWKTGYWHDFLKGKPYHISALYVVDLVRFRQIAAGDILRGQYQQLSADPNSLANLDQDLPNNLQREVPIFSLHEDWLWCETWCSKDRLHRAKTIDLCQNPLTKEPKLARARQIPEWEEYDREIANFARELAEKGLIKSRIAAADTNVLASAGSGTGAGAGAEEKGDESASASDSVGSAKEGQDAKETQEGPRDEL